MVVLKLPGGVVGRVAFRELRANAAGRLEYNWRRFHGLNFEIETMEDGMPQPSGAGRLARRIGHVAAMALLMIAQGAQGARYLMPEPNAPRVGELLVMNSKYEDTLAQLAQRYGVGYRELADANPDVDPWIPGEGTPIVLPTEYLLPPGPREGIVLNLAEFRLYYYVPSGAEVVTFPIGIGRSSFPTPKTDTKIVGRVRDPTWYPGEAARTEYAAEGRPLPRAVPAGPDNPMGSMALILGIKSYFIHGTNKPFGVGQQASFGCVRLYPDDIEDLAANVPNGTRVRIIDEPVKVAWVNDELFLEVHKDLNEQSSFEAVTRAVVTAVGDSGVEVNWERVEEMARKANGIPEPILSRARQIH